MMMNYLNKNISNVFFIITLMLSPVTYANPVDSNSNPELNAESTTSPGTPEAPALKNKNTTSGSDTNIDVNNNPNVDAKAPYIVKAPAATTGN
jgi:hypothetical protein